MDYLTVEEAAKALALSVRAIRERIRRGDMRAERLGARVWAIPRSEVERWQVIGRLKPGPRRRAHIDPIDKSSAGQKGPSSAARSDS